MVTSVLDSLLNHSSVAISRDTSAAGADIPFPNRPSERTSTMIPSATCILLTSSGTFLRYHNWSSFQSHEQQIVHRGPQRRRMKLSSLRREYSTRRQKAAGTVDSVSGMIAGAAEISGIGGLVQMDCQADLDGMGISELFRLGSTIL